MLHLSLDRSPSALPTPRPRVVPTGSGISLSPKLAEPQTPGSWLPPTSVGTGWVSAGLFLAALSLSSGRMEDWRREKELRQAAGKARPPGPPVASLPPFPLCQRRDSSGLELGSGSIGLSSLPVRETAFGGVVGNALCRGHLGGKAVKAQPLHPASKARCCPSAPVSTRQAALIEKVS